MSSFKGAGSDAAAPDACLVVVRPGAAGLAPLVEFDPAGGDVSSFHVLPGALPIDRAVYG